MPFVVDNSVVAAWHFSSQATAYTDAMLDKLVSEVAHVPGYGRWNSRTWCARR